jgi:hypothetical protein
MAPDDPALNYLLAEVLFRKDISPGTTDFQEAKAAAQRAGHTKPDFARAYDVLSVLDLRSGQTSQAADIARRARKAAPQDLSPAYHPLVRLRKEGDKKGLPQLAKKLAKISPAARERTAPINCFRTVEEEAGYVSSTQSN